MRQTISKTLSTVYKRAKKELPILLVLFQIGFVVGTLFYFVGKLIDATSALSFLGTIAQMSATIFSIFSAALLFLLKDSSGEVREIISKGDLIASYLLFTLAIFHSLLSILSIEPNAPVDLRTPYGFILVILPLWWMTAAILIVALFIWKLYVRRV